VLLAYLNDPPFFSVGRALGLLHQRCIERVVAYGILAALGDSPRPGREPVITVEARAWLADLACRKAKDLVHPHELWTTRRLARHALAWADSGPYLFGRIGARHGVQQPRCGRGDAAQGALPAAARSGFPREDGGGVDRRVKLKNKKPAGLADGQGNFGNIDGDNAAAQRAWAQDFAQRYPLAISATTRSGPDGMRQMNEA